MNDKREPHILFCDGYESWGGVQWWMHGAARGLAARGWGITVATRPDSVFGAKAEAAGLTTVRWPLRCDFDVPSMIAAHRYFRKRRPDAVVVGLGRDIRTIGPVARLHRIPLVWRVGEYSPCGWFHRATGKGLVDRVITDSHDLKGYLEGHAWLKDKVQIIPNGITGARVPDPGEVRAARARLGWHEDEFIILFVGRLVGRKGVGELITAFAEMSERYPRARLVLVGSGRYEERCRELIDVHGLQARVTLAGYQAETTPYYLGCDLVMVPSRREVFGLVLLEAMALARPIVATRVGGIPEVVGDEGAWLVPPRDPKALAEAMAALAKDPERRHRLARAGFDRVRKQFQEATMLDRIEEEFRRIIQSAGRNRGGERIGSSSTPRV